MRVLLVCLVGIAITACESDGASSFTGNHASQGSGGGGSGGGGGGSATASTTGVWNGTLKTTGGATAAAITCLLAKNGQVGCLFFDPDPLSGTITGGAVGAMTTTGPAFAANAFTAPGYAFFDGSGLSTFNVPITTVVERSILDGTTTLGGSFYNVDTTFDGVSDHPSSLAAIAGSYVSFSLNGVPASLSIDANGVLFSQSQLGCVANGSVAVIDPTVNGYTVHLDVSNCAFLNGSYNGLAIATDDTHFFFVAFEADTGIVGSAVK